MSRRRDTSRVDTAAAAAALERLAGGDVQAQPAEPMTLRRWDAAQTSRLNKAHWQEAQGQPINVDIAAHLPTLMARCAHEAETNAMVQGVIETHVTDLIGDAGPELQIESDNPVYSEWLEEIWSLLWEQPDIEGELSGVEMMQMWVRMLWRAGAYLYRTINDPTVDGPVQMRLRQYHPRRLMTPMNQAHDPYTVMGVEMHKSGKVKGYWIDQSPESDHLASLYNEPKLVEADLVGHRFQRNEPGQVRGIPWLAPCLQVIADIRDGDNEILDAVRNAAEFAVFGVATGPDVDHIPVNETTDLERRTLKMMAPGYNVSAVQANQPNTSYLDFRDERIREIGAPVQMPLLRVKHDASDHNYSSARFDDLGYWRGIGRTRHWISSRDLAPLLRKVEREARLSQMSAGKAVPRPKDFRSVQLMWHWPQPQRLDLNREWSGLGIQRALGALSFDQMLDSTGTNRDEYLAQEKRSRAAFEKAGIPYPEMDQVLKAVKILGDAESIDQPANKKTRDKPAPTPKEASSASA